MMTALNLLPSLVVAVVGVVLAIARWSRHPMASMLLTVGLLLRVGVSLANVVAMEALRSQVGVVSALYLATNVVGVMGLGLIIAAVFAERPNTDPARG